MASGYATWFFLPQLRASTTYDLCQVLAIPVGSLDHDDDAVVMIQGATFVEREAVRVRASGEAPPWEARDLVGATDLTVQCSRDLLGQAFSHLDGLDLQEAVCVSVGASPPFAPMAMAVFTDQNGDGYVEAAFDSNVDRETLARLGAVGVTPLACGDSEGQRTRVGFALAEHLDAARHGQYRRGANCNAFFLAHGTLLPDVVAGLDASARAKIRTTRARLVSAALTIASSSATAPWMTCRSPVLAHGCGDLVARGMLLAGLRTPQADDRQVKGEVGAAIHLAASLRDQASDGGFAFSTGGLPTATDSVFVLLGLRDRHLIAGLARYHDGRGGMLVQPPNSARRIPAAVAHWERPDDVTTCLARYLRHDVGLPELTPISWLVDRFNTRGSVFITSPWLVDWAWALGLSGDPSNEATRLREDLQQELVSSANADWSFGAGDQQILATAAAVCALDALGDASTELIRRASRVRLAALLDDRHRRVQVPFASTRLLVRGGAVANGGAASAAAVRAMLNPDRPGHLRIAENIYELTTYEDTAGAVTAGLCLLALRDADVDIAVGSGVPWQDPQVHGRYQASPAEYMARYVLGPLTDVSS